MVPDPHVSQRLALSLHRATSVVDRVADAYLRTAHGIGISAFSTLITIQALGPARQSDIARGLGVSRAAVTQRLAELVDRGWVHVAPDAVDSRANAVSLTDAGAQLLAQAWGGLAQSNDGLEDGVDIATLQRQLDALIANGERHLARIQDAS